MIGGVVTVVEVDGVAAVAKLGAVAEEVLPDPVLEDDVVVVAGVDAAGLEVPVFNREERKPSIVWRRAVAFAVFKFLRLRVLTLELETEGPEASIGLLDRIRIGIAPRTEE